MADFAPAFESKDTQGSTAHLNGTVGTTSVLIPPAPGAKVSTFLLRMPLANDVDSVLYVAADGQTTYLSMIRGEYFQWSPKNTTAGAAITQIRILGSKAGITYECIMDFEPL